MNIQWLRRQDLATHERIYRALCAQAAICLAAGLKGPAAEALQQQEWLLSLGVIPKDSATTIKAHILAELSQFRQAWDEFVGSVQINKK